MNDDLIDDLVRAGDPVPGSRVGELHGADADLMEQIVASSGRSRPAPIQVHPIRRRLTAGLVAAACAAVVTGLVATALTGSDPGPDRSADGQAVRAGADTLVYAASAVRVAEGNDRFLVDLPGWRAVHADAFSRDQGGITYESAGRRVEVNWYPTRYYRTYDDDRTEVGARTATSIDGQPGSRVSYSSTDVAVMLEPSGRTFTEIRASGRFADHAAVLAVLDRVRGVSVDQWLASLPDDIVSPARSRDVVRQLLADVPVPRGLEQPDLVPHGVNDRYQVGAETIRRVECAWFGQWTRAWAAGDDRSAAEAVRALRSARDWDVLRELDRTGDFSEGPWTLADRISVGDDPATYAQSVDCPIP